MSWFTRYWGKFSYLLETCLCKRFDKYHVCPVQSWQTDILFGCNSKRAKKIDHKKWPFFLGPIERENWGGRQRGAKFGGGSPNLLSTTWHKGRSQKGLEVGAWNAPKTSSIQYTMYRT